MKNSKLYRYEELINRLIIKLTESSITYSIERKNLLRSRLVKLILAKQKYILNSDQNTQFNPAWAVEKYIL